MKLYNWIDSLLDTKQKRRIVILILLLIYWLWQNVWQALLYFQLLHISEYSSLFVFLDQMDQYNQSLLVRCLYEILMTNSMPIFKIILNILQQFCFMDVICIGLTIICFLSSARKKQWLKPIAGYVLLFIYNLVIIAIGYQQGSLSGVIHILNFMAIGSLIFELYIIGVILLQLIKKIYNYTIMRNVHDV